MTPSDPIDLPFTRDSALHVLACGTHPNDRPYSHKQIAEWCDRFWCQYLEIDPEPAIQALLLVLKDVDMQWELHLVNTYSIDELRSRSFEREMMPEQWFHDWLAQIGA